MMRRSVDGDDAPLDVFGASDPFDIPPVDVAFGGRTPRQQRPPNAPHGAPKRRVNPWLVGVGVTALIGGAFVFGSHRGEHEASPPATGVRQTQPAKPSPISAARATSAPSIAPVTVPGSAAQPTTTVPSLGPLYANGTGLGIFLVAADNYGSSELQRIDLQTGAFETVAPRSISNNSQIVGVAPSDGGVVPIVATYDNGQANAAPGPDGTVWLFGGTDPTLRRVRYRADGTYEVLETIPGFRSTSAIALLGSTSDLRPVVQLQDGRGYDVAPDTGGLRRITDGSPTRFVHGYFGETICADDGTCVLRLHGNGSSHDIPSPSGYLSTSFSPDGRTVLVVSQTSGSLAAVTSTLIDIGSGDSQPVTMLTQSYLAGDEIVWTPDSSSFFWVERGGSSLSRLDVASRVIVRYDISTQLGTYRVQGLAGLA